MTAKPLRLGVNVDHVATIRNARGGPRPDPVRAAKYVAPGFICREVLIELVWVLERAYTLPRPDIARALDGLMEARELVIEAADRAAIAVDRYRKGGPGFADQMIALAGQGAGCQATVTFDRKAAGLPGMSLLGTVSDH